MRQEALEERLREAIHQYWQTRQTQQDRQVASGKADAGSRGAVTGGAQMLAFEQLLVNLSVESGVPSEDIHRRAAINLPGYYRPEKEWDLLVVSRGQLVAAIELKSQAGPSFGNNFNNRVEEAVGNATDFWTAYREGRFGAGPRPFLGYFFLLEDCDKVRRPVRNEEPHFPVDPVFANASYSQRYEIFCHRLVYERLYDSVCLTLATKPTMYSATRISHPAGDLTFYRFVATLQGHITTWLRSQ
ncbi:MAG: PaeR7I family type II restriction endonuclease [Sphaerobacter sp.]|nr:PaeR7I family type II restriction endonuclease [Sphaerobacter sp.]